MNWLANLWRALVSKTSTVDEVTEEVTQVEVEEVSEPCGELFAHICREAGVKQRTLDSANLVDLFEDWYSGECDEQSIRDCIAGFKAKYPVANAKLQGKL